MEQSKKNLKFMSIAMLILAFLSLARVSIELVLTDFSGANISQELILIVSIVFAAISVILLVPQFYIGVKGIKMAKNPDSSKAHITWCTILLVVSAIGFVAYVVESITEGNFTDNIPVFFDLVLDILCYSEYNKYAKMVRANA